MSDPIPDRLQGPLAKFEENLAEVRTRRIRLEEREVPDSPTADPEELAEAVKRSDAPDKLEAVAKAVEEGRATWEDVAHGRIGVASEIDELFAASGPGIVDGMREAEEEEARLAAAEQQRSQVVDQYEDDDFSEMNFLDTGR